jgi:hypothetical protein
MNKSKNQNSLRIGLVAITVVLISSFTFAATWSNSFEWLGFARASAENTRETVKEKTVPTDSFVIETYNTTETLGLPDYLNYNSALFPNNSSTVFINEIHYDDIGGDLNEFVEVAAPAGTNLADYSIVLYNGSNGTSYDTDALMGVATNESGGYGLLKLTMRRYKMARRTA